MASTPAAQAPPLLREYVPSTPLKVRERLCSDQIQYIYDHPIGELRDAAQQDSEMQDASAEPWKRPPSPQTIDHEAALQLLHESDASSRSEQRTNTSAATTPPPLPPPLALRQTRGRASALLEQFAQRAQKDLDDKIKAMQAISVALDGALTTLQGNGSFTETEMLVTDFIRRCQATLLGTGALSKEAHARYSPEQPQWAIPSRTKADPVANKAQPPKGLQQSSWAAIAAASSKNDRTRGANNSGSHTNPQNQNHPHRDTGPPPAQPKEQLRRAHTQKAERQDLRVFLRLHQHSPTWNKDAMTIRVTIAKHHKLSTDRFPRIDRNATGFAVHCKDITTQQLLLREAEHWGIFFNARAIEKHEPWFNYVVPGVPRQVQSWDGEDLPMEPLWHDEILASTGQVPVSVRLPKKDNGTGREVSLLVSFRRPLQGPLRIFGQRGSLLVKTRPILQCTNCWGFHPTRYCRRHQHCSMCSQKHSDDAPCQQPIQCVNCKGPHPATQTTCPARPVKRHGQIEALSRNQIRKIQTEGRRSFQAVHPETNRRSSSLLPELPAQTSPSARVANKRVRLTTTQQDAFAPSEC